MFKSTNGGQSFTDVSGNLPDVPATWVTLRGKQLIVGTDVGVFATNPKGKPSYSYLNGLPVVPISTMNLKPDDPNLLVVATYGRGIWTYCFDQAVPRHDGRLPDHAAAAAGEAAGRDGHHARRAVRLRARRRGLDRRRRTAPLGVTQWQRFPAGNTSAASFGSRADVHPRHDDDARLAGVQHAGRLGVRRVREQAEHGGRLRLRRDGRRVVGERHRLERRQLAVGSRTRTTGAPRPRSTG